jgi:L-threonylcarbamoyladenylate synthase
MNQDYPQDIVKAAQTLREGALVVLPTETVYGLAADASNSTAVAAIYALKDRPRFNPLIVHVSSLAMAQRYGVWNAQAEALAQAFWPGPLTLVLPLREGCGISALVTNGGTTIALRLPAHPMAQALIGAFGAGVAAPSANRSGRVSPTAAAHVRDEFGEACPLLLDGGDCHVGLESTVLDVTTNPPTLLRPGAITKEMIFNVSESYPQALDKDNSVDILRSPGQLLSHYAPSLPVRLNATSVAANEALLAFGTPLAGAAITRNLSERANVTEAAANLFAHLRALDQPALARAIAVMPIPNTGIGEAINERLSRAV